MKTPTHNEFIRQCMNAVERAKAMLEATATRVTTAEDPYAGLMWSDDADTLGETMAVLRSVLHQEDDTQVYMDVVIAREVAARLSCNTELDGKAKRLLLALASAVSARTITVRDSQSWGMCIVEDGLRRTRPMTRKETWLYRLFNVKPERV